MQLTVRDWMMELVVFVDPDISVTEVLAIMRRRYIHSVIVNKTETNPEYGILTSTDICDKIVAYEMNPNTVKVRDIMSPKLITVTTNMTLPECSRIMKENRIHHLPVEDENGKLVGMISASDFLVAAEAVAHSYGGERFS